jgi:hypothetical protein
MLVCFFEIVSFREKVYYLTPKKFAKEIRFSVEKKQKKLIFQT